MYVLEAIRLLQHKTKECLMTFAADFVDFLNIIRFSSRFLDSGLCATKYLPITY